MENKKFNIEKLEFNKEIGKYRKIILEKLKNTKLKVIKLQQKFYENLEMKRGKCTI